MKPVSRFTIAANQQAASKYCMSLAQPKRILIIKLRHHGDVLLSTPVVDALKTRFPDCEIDMLVYAGTGQLIADNPQIAQIFTIDRNWKKLGVFKQLACEKNLLSKLKARDYDWAFNLSDQWRAAIIAKLCARCSVGLDCIKRDGFWWRFCHDFINHELDTSHHIVENQLNILAPLIQPEDVADAKVRLWVAQDARESMRQKLREQGWNGEDYVLMHPGARWHFKCWEDGKNAAIVQLLLNSGQNVVLTASPDTVEQYMLQEIIGRLNIPEGRKVYVLSGCLSLRELAAAIEGAKLFIGVDSAPMHIAAALDKPQIALFGASWVDKWRPYSEQAEVIYAGDYTELPHPDSIDTNDPTRLLKAIPLQDVWDKISAKLEALEA